MKRIPEQGDIWETYLPWISVGKELKWEKNTFKNPSRPVFITSGARMRFLNRAIIAPIGSNPFPLESLSSRITKGDKGNVHEGSVYINQLQGFPIKVRHDTVCEGGYILLPDESPFIAKRDTIHFKTAEMLALIEQLLNCEVTPNSTIQPGSVINVEVEKNIKFPAVVLFLTNNRLLTIVYALRKFSKEHETRNGVFIIQNNETNLKQNLSIGIALIRTVDRSRCDNEILGQLSRERRQELMDKISRYLLY